MKCRVLRPFPGPNGTKFVIGELVETSEWTNRERLMEQRYIQPAVLSSGFEQASVELDGAEETVEAPFSAPVMLKKKKRRIFAGV